VQFQKNDNNDNPLYLSIFLPMFCFVSSLPSFSLSLFAIFKTYLNAEKKKK